MNPMTLIPGNRQSVFDLAGAVWRDVRRSPSDLVLVIRPNGAATLRLASSRSTQCIAHDHPEQIVGLFSRLSSITTIRDAINEWAAAGGCSRTLAPIQLSEGRKSMWGGSMFRSPRRPAPRPFTPSRRVMVQTCPDHGIRIPMERGVSGRMVPGSCPECDKRRAAARAAERERIMGGR